jgi:hypothetical protein
MGKHYLFIGFLMLSALGASAAKGISGTNNGSSNISGTVVTESAKPLNKVTVVISAPCLPKPQSVETDENGNFNFSQLEPCTYKLTFESKGYNKVINDKVVVVSDKKTQLKVQLQPQCQTSDCLWNDSDHGTFSSQLQIYD